MKNFEALFLTGSHFNPTQEEVAILFQEFPEVKLTIKGQKEYTSQDVKKADIIVGSPKPTYLIEAPRLKWLQTPSAGIQQYSDKALFANQEVILTNASGTYGKQISDHVIGAIIAHNHNFFTYKEQMKEGLWKEYFPTSNIFESTILILGYGDIGKHIAKKAKALDMHVIVVSRTMRKNCENVDEYYTTSKLDEVLKKADYLVLSSASTQETQNIIDRRRISLLKEGSYIINIARGNLIDEIALIEALQSGKLGGATLDVCAKEPLEHDSTLWSLDNVYITPHSSGLAYNVPSTIFSLFLDNLRHFMRNEKMKNVVDFERRY